jgi:hypothetical protein
MECVFNIVRVHQLSIFNAKSSTTRGIATQLHSIS